MAMARLGARACALRCIAPAPHGKDRTVLNIPNILTLSRIVVIPLLVAAFYFPKPTDSWVACGLFVVASVTDYLDGYLARAWQQQSRFGQFLDPIADKILVAVALMMLVAHQWVSEWTVLPALIILAREFLVSGLREFLAQLKVGMPVSRLAKWKTTVQMVAIGILLGGPAGESQLTWLPVTAIGEAALWVAAVLTLITGYDYCRASLEHLRDEKKETRG